MGPQGVWLAGWLRTKAGAEAGTDRDLDGPIWDVATGTGALTVYKQMLQLTLQAL